MRRLVVMIALFAITAAGLPAALLDRAQAADVAPPPGYAPPVYAPPVYAPLPPPVAVVPVRPACGLRWRCGPLGCGWIRVCYPSVYAAPFTGYGPRPFYRDDYGPY